MFSANQVLDQLLSAVMQPSAGQKPSPQSAGLGELLGGLLNQKSQQSAGLGGLLGGLLNQGSQQNAGLGGLLGGLLNQGSQQNADLGGLLGGLLSGGQAGAGGGLLGGLLGNQGVRKLGGMALASGGAATLGGMAIAAFRKWQASQSAGAPAHNFAQQPQQFALNFNTLPPAQQEDNSRAMLSAIIAASKSDGHISEREQKIITGMLEQLGPEAVAWVQEEIRKPLDVNKIAAMATSPEMAAKIYLASLFTIDKDNELEMKYINLLAAKLKLDPQLRKELEQQWAHAST
jgi:uncharacterized membrane protein YebE (DUF533 family)